MKWTSKFWKVAFVPVIYFVRELLDVDGVTVDSTYKMARPI